MQSIFRKIGDVWHPVHKSLIINSCLSITALQLLFKTKRCVSKDALLDCTFSTNNEEEFNSRVLYAQIPIIVQFSAEWICHTADMMPKLTAEINQHPGKLMATSVDVDQFSKLAYRYKIFSVPTLLLFNKGKVVESREGTMKTKDLNIFINHALELT